MRKHNIEINVFQLFSYVSLLLVISFCVAGGAYYDHSDVLLIANNNSEISLDITNYFKTQRSIPESRIVYLNCSTSETISFTEFTNNIRTPIENFITSNNLTINYIVTTKGIPLRTTNPHRSVDSTLTLILGPYNSSIGGGKIQNPYCNKEEMFSHQKFGIYLVTRLTGYNYDDVKDIIDNAVYIGHNKTSETFVLDSDPTKDGYFGTMFYNHYIIDAGPLLEAEGWNVTVDTTTTYLTNQDNVLGYCSWGSNDCCDTNNAKPGNTWMSGAIAETYVSTSGRTFTYPPVYGQSLVADWIAEGVTGMKGYVFEPYLGSVAIPTRLFGRYTDGYVLADSFYMASGYLNWMGVVVGDPKAHITLETVLPIVVLNYPLDDSRINNGTIINLTVSDPNLDSVWYSRGDGNITLPNPYDINTSGWECNNYTVTVWANDTVGNNVSKDYQFEIAPTIGVQPKYTHFGGNTTDFKKLPDLTNVAGAVLETGSGGIEFNGTLNFSGVDMDSNIDIMHNFISLDAVALSGLNTSANLTLYNIPYQHPIILMNGEPCPPEICQIISCSDETLKFNVTHFTNYSSDESANLTIWDETDAGMPYGDQAKYVGQSVRGFANFTYKVNGSAILNAECNISFVDSVDNVMAYNLTTELYEYERSFSNGGVHAYDVVCYSGEYGPLTAMDDVTVYPIEISECSELNITGATYLLTAAIINHDGDCMHITADDITLDCQGHTIDGMNEEGVGIRLQSVSNVMIKNCIISDFIYDYLLENSENINLNGKFTITPSSDIYITISNFTSTYKKWIELGSEDGMYAVYVIGDTNANTKHTVNVYAHSNGTKMQTFYITSNSSGYIMYNTTGFGYERYTEVIPIAEPTPSIIVVSVIAAVLAGAGYAIRRWVRKV